MKFVTAAQMREIDRLAIEEFGIPSIVLMENAGIACANEIVKFLKSKKDHVSIFSGKGNNGGDGFVIARHLSNRGFSVSVLYFQEPNQMKPDAFINFEILEKMRIDLIPCLASELNRKKIEAELRKSQLIVDALFGTGLSKAVTEPFKSAIELMNESKKKIVAVDIPSGMNADSGEIMEIGVRANLTVTMGASKKGFTFKHARRYTGNIVIADISIPKVLFH